MSKKIKSQTVYRFDHIPGEQPGTVPQNAIRYSMQEYGETGQLLVEISFTSDGEIGDKNEFIYDGSGRLIGSKIYGEDNEILERNEIIRDNDGRIACELVHYLDGSVDTRSYFYDENGNLTGMEVKDDEDEIEFSEKYHYENNLLVKVERYNENDEITFYQKDSFENGMITRRETWSSEEEEPYTLVTEYNSHGRRERVTRYDSRENPVERNVYEEDDRGRIIRMIEENKQHKNTTDFIFDDRGNVIRQVEVDLNNNLNHEIFRAYDDDGNLLTATVESVVKGSGAIRAYTLYYVYEFYND